MKSISQSLLLIGKMSALAALFFFASLGSTYAASNSPLIDDQECLESFNECYFEAASFMSAPSDPMCETYEDCDEDGKRGGGPDDTSEGDERGEDEDSGPDDDDGGF